MKTCLRLSAALLLGLFLCLPARSDAATSLAWHRHTTDYYLVALPQGWEVNENMKMGLYAISLVSVRPLKPNDVFRENVNVVTENVDPSFDLTEYVNTNVTGMKKALNQFQLINSGELQGAYTPCRYMTYTQVAEQYNGTLKAVVFFYLSHGKAYSMTCTSTQESFAAWFPTFVQIGKSFNFPKAQ
ncbi:MAG TPA: hypothetical protein VHE12_05235 [bacterium]|nr:hypothetical protein [bacterium]